MRFNFDVATNDLPGAILIVLGAAAAFAGDVIINKFVSEEKRPKFSLITKLLALTVVITGVLLVIY